MSVNKHQFEKFGYLSLEGLIKSNAVSRLVEFCKLNLNQLSCPEFNTASEQAISFREGARSLMMNDRLADVLSELLGRNIRISQVLIRDIDTLQTTDALLTEKYPSIVAPRETGIHGTGIQGERLSVGVIFWLLNNNISGRNKVRVTLRPNASVDGSTPLDGADVEVGIGDVTIFDHEKFRIEFNKQLRESKRDYIIFAEYSYRWIKRKQDLVPFISADILSVKEQQFFGRPDSLWDLYWPSDVSIAKR